MKRATYVLFFVSIIPPCVFAQDTKVGEHQGIGQASSSELYRLAVGYNDALDHCTRSGCANIEEVMNYFADDAVRTSVGNKPQAGKKAIRESFLERAERLQQVVEIKGIDLWGDMVVCRLERRDTTHRQAGVEHHLRILLVKGGKIKHLIVLIDPEEDAHLRRQVN